MFCFQDVVNANLNITRNFLKSVDENGAWGVNEYAPWAPVVTALVVDHLLLCGLTVEKEWLLEKDGKTYHLSLNKSLEFLNSCVREDGSFGADFWDTCRFADIVVSHHLEECFSFDSTKEYIIDYVTNGKHQLDINNPDHSGDWSGPGTYAACARFLLHIQENNLAKQVIEDALKLKQSNGSFQGKKNRAGESIVHPVWHTAQMLSVLVSAGYSAQTDLINSICGWIQSAMAEDGSFSSVPKYDAYYVSYALMAFLSLPSRPEVYVERTMSYLLENENDGVVEGVSASIMAAEAFDVYLGKNETLRLYQMLEMEQYAVLQKENDELKRTIEEKNEIISEYEEKYKDADVILSKKEAWKFGILITVIIFVAGILVPTLISAFGDYLSQMIKGIFIPS